MRILLVEDDELLGSGLKRALTRDNYLVDWLMDGKQALQAIQTDEFALVILDLTLPGLDDLVEELEEMKFEESPEDIMDHQSLGYTDAQIKRIARYFASLPKSEEGNHESESEHEENNESDHEEKEDD